MKTVCSFISPVSELRKRARTKIGWEYVCALTALFHGELRRIFKSASSGRTPVRARVDRKVRDRRDGLEASRRPFHEQVEAVSLNFEKVGQG